MVCGCIRVECREFAASSGREVFADGFNDIAPDEFRDEMPSGICEGSAARVVRCGPHDSPPSAEQPDFRARRHCLSHSA